MELSGEIKRLEMKHFRTVFNFPASQPSLLERFDFDPLAAQQAVIEVIERALQLVAGSKASIRREHFLVWTHETVWLNRRNQLDQVINTKVTSGLSSLQSASCFKEAFHSLPESLFPEGGGDPIADGAMPIYWYNGGVSHRLDLQDQIALIRICRELYLERTLFRSRAARNPYAELLLMLEQLNGV